MVSPKVHDDSQTPYVCFQYAYARNYRIAYAARDEFAGVCADFNEMAGRFLDMVNARQKDDENRRELIAGISHDLRTPLTSIKAYIEGLEAGVAATPESRARYINTIKSKAGDLEHIIAQLFLFSKLDIGSFPFRMETFDIGLALSEFVKTAGEEYRQKGLCLDLAENTRGIRVTADRVQLGNVFANILENSVKYGNKFPSAPSVGSVVSPLVGTAAPLYFLLRLMLRYAHVRWHAAGNSLSQVQAQQAGCREPCHSCGFLCGASVRGLPGALQSGPQVQNEVLPAAAQDPFFPRGEVRGPFCV
jgi:hypothetical protein